MIDENEPNEGSFLPRFVIRIWPTLALSPEFFLLGKSRRASESDAGGIIIYKMPGATRDDAVERCGPVGGADHEED